MPALAVILLLCQDIPDLIRELDADELEVRDRAAARLVERFEEAEAAIRTALERERNPEIVLQLKRIVSEGEGLRRRSALKRKLPPELLDRYPDLLPSLLGEEGAAWLDAVCLTGSGNEGRSGVAAYISPLARRAILLAVLEEGRNHSIRAVAAEHLAEFIGNEEVATALHRWLKTTDPDLYKSVARSLARIRVPTSATALLEGFRELPPDLQQECVHAVARIGSPTVVPQVEWMLRSGSPEERRAAARLAETLVLPGLGALMTEFIESDDPEKIRLALESHAAPPEKLFELTREGSAFRADAIRTLADMGAPGVAGPMKDLLKDESAEIRREAVRYFGVLGLVEAADDLAAALSDPNRAVVREALWSLGRIQAVEKVPDIVKVFELRKSVRPDAMLALRSLEARTTAGAIAAHVSDAAIGRDVLEALSFWEVDEATPAILDGLSAKDAWIRYNSIQALMVLGAGPHAGSIRPLLGDINHQVRYAALDALTVVKDEEAIEAVRRLLRSTDAQMLIRSIRYLDAVAGDADAEAIRALRTHADTYVRGEVAGYLGRHDIEWAGEMARDAEPMVRAQAIRWLGVNGGEPSTILRALSDPSPKVRAAAIRAGSKNVEAVLAAVQKNRGDVELGALASLADPVFVPDLKRLLTHPSRPIRLKALASLLRVGTPAADEAAFSAYSLNDSKMKVEAIESALRLRRLDPVRRLLAHPEKSVRFETVMRLQALLNPGTWKHLSGLKLRFSEDFKSTNPREIISRIRRTGRVRIRFEGPESRFQSEATNGFNETENVGRLLRDACAITWFEFAFLLEEDGGVLITTLDRAVEQTREQLSR